MEHNAVAMSTWRRCRGWIVYYWPSQAMPQSASCLFSGNRAIADLSFAIQDKPQFPKQKSAPKRHIAPVYARPGRCSRGAMASIVRIRDKQKGSCGAHIAIAVGGIAVASAAIMSAAHGQWGGTSASRTYRVVMHMEVSSGAMGCRGRSR